MAGACINGVGFIERCGGPIAHIIEPAGPNASYSNLSPSYVVANRWNETSSAFSFTAPLGAAQRSQASTPSSCSETMTMSLSTLRNPTVKRKRPCYERRFSHTWRWGAHTTSETRWM